MQVCRASGCGVRTYGKEEETSAGSAGEKDGGLPRLPEGYRSFWIINKACQYAVPKQDHHWPTAYPLCTVDGGCLAA
jgi:hypothetical protein